MSFDRLQKSIRAKKCPVALTLGWEPQAIPPQLRQGHDRKAQAQALLQYSLGLLEAVGELIPAVVLRVPYWEAWGWQGMEALEEAAHAAHEAGLFVIADARRGDAGQAALACGSGWLGSPDVDCLTLSGYQGSDAILPLLEPARREDKSLLVLVRTANPSAGEIQELVSGDRILCQAVGDLTQRLGREDVGQMGYSRLGAVVGTSWPSDLRALRKRMEQTFFLLEGDLAPEDARFAFDKYGRGALLAPEGPSRAWMESGDEDYRGAARRALTELRDALKQFITIL